MKQECDNEETDAANVYEQVITSLSKQIEELSVSMDCLRQSDQNLTLSLRMAEQRAMEAETKLRHAVDRCVSACMCACVCVYRLRNLYCVCVCVYVCVCHYLTTKSLIDKLPDTEWVWVTMR